MLQYGSDTSLMSAGPSGNAEEGAHAANGRAQSEVQPVMEKAQGAAAGEKHVVLGGDV